MPPDAQTAIILAIEQSEGRIRGELAEVKSEVNRIRGECHLRHKYLDSDVEELKACASAQRQAHDAQVKTQLDDRKKWLFWIVTTIAIIISSTTVTLLIGKLS